jgi:hypothetical protein
MSTEFVSPRAKGNENRSWIDFEVRDKHLTIRFRSTHYIQAINKLKGEKDEHKGN